MPRRADSVTMTNEIYKYSIEWTNCCWQQLQGQELEKIQMECCEHSRGSPTHCNINIYTYMYMYIYKCVSVYFEVCKEINSNALLGSQAQ